MESLNAFIEAANGVLFSEYVVYALLLAGLLFTIWSAFGQYRALTHGVQVVRGKYDHPDDPGAINHFQALSAALSATVGLGNIAGVAVAVALGGPGAVLWMWVIGVVGMALKMTEVTQSMIFRNTDDPENPHGGPMFVVKHGLAQAVGKGASSPLSIAAGLLFAAVIIGCGLVSGNAIVIAVCTAVALLIAVLGFVKGAMLGSLIGGIFVVTLLISAITGGNMFQAWNVADVTFTYFEVPQIVTGIILAVIVGAVIVGGIKRIGNVAGRLVPFMCVLYLLAAIYVLVMNAGAVPGMLALIVKSGLPEWLGGEAASAQGAFLGGTFGYAAMWGVKRALFSSEAGQGSAPIAHSAAKTDEPVREGVVAGLEPFIDTIVVCTMTALVILCSGAYDRPAESTFATPDQVNVTFTSDQIGSIPTGSLAQDTSPTESILVEQAEGAEEEEELLHNVFVFTHVSPTDSEEIFPLSGVLYATGENQQSVTWSEDELERRELELSGLVPTDGVLYAGADPEWTLETPPLPPRNAEAKRIHRVEEGPGWNAGETVFMIVHADEDPNTGRDLRRITGTVKGTRDEGYTVDWNTLTSEREPTFIAGADEEVDIGIYGDYAGASLTAHAFDRVTPGLGMWLVSLAAWLFAISTMISWSYYGEQGVVYLFGRARETTISGAVFVYKIIYCLLIVGTTFAAMKIFGDEGNQAIIGTDAELDMWTTLGLGVMLVANIPIMLLFGHKAMGVYHDYMGKLKRGEFHPHGAPSIPDVVEGHDVEKHEEDEEH